jgi:hypothetical protein
MPGGYQFNGNAEDVFREFFGGAGGGAGGFADLFAKAAAGGGMGGSPFVFSMGPGGPRFSAGGRPAGAQQQPRQPQQQPVACTLEELYRGTQKRAAANGVSYTIDVRPGWKAGTKINFDERVSFVIVEQAHPRFVRAGDDLTLWCHVRVTDLLTGSRQSVQTLDGRTITAEFGPLQRVVVSATATDGWRGRASRRAAWASRGAARLALGNPPPVVQPPPALPSSSIPSLDFPGHCQRGHADLENAGQEGQALRRRLAHLARPIQRAQIVGNSVCVRARHDAKTAAQIARRARARLERTIAGPHQRS